MTTRPTLRSRPATTATPRRAALPTRSLFALDDPQRLRYRNAVSTDIRATFLAAKRRAAAEDKAREAAAQAAAAPTPPAQAELELGPNVLAIPAPRWRTGQ